MPGKKQVPTLVELSMSSVGQYITLFARSIIKPVSKAYKKSPELGHMKLQSSIQAMKQLLKTSVPWYLHNEVALVTLSEIANLIEETRDSKQYFLKECFRHVMNIIVSLTEVVINANLKSIEFRTFPKIMRHVLYSKLHDMTGLQTLDLGSDSAGWKMADAEKIIINGIFVMPNLLSFTLCFECTDNIITAISQNCKKLQKLDVTASKSVTDRSIPALINCQYLKEIKLCRTSVTVSGYADLFVQHPCLDDIGRCDEFGYALSVIYDRDNYSKEPLRLKTFESRNLNMEHMYLMKKMCPYVTNLAILYSDNLMLLSTFDNLEELKLFSCSFYTHRLKRFLELKGANIVSLHLEHVEEIDLDALYYISQYCPALKNLVLYNCEFLDHALSRRNFEVPPFKSLERLKCVVECANMHLRFILSHCTEIKFIQLGSSTGIDDTTMMNILRENPMSKLEELKILYSHDLSINTVRLLMQKCGSLRRLSELENWQGITVSELMTFRREVRRNNINLDTRPSFCFA